MRFPVAEVLDLFCCQGGATRGYQEAGFRVTGVDISPQPRYVGEEFHQGDAVAFVWDNLEKIRRRFAFISASPPCQGYSRAWKIQQRDHPRLIAATRAALELTGLPWVIENVEEARGELRDPVMLCGAMFGHQTYRHRLFEAGGGLVLTRPEHPEHVAPLAKMGRPRRPGEFAHYVGNFSGVAEAREDMGMPWANRDGLREAIPPSYARWVGEHVRASLALERAA